VLNIKPKKSTVCVGSLMDQSLRKHITDAMNQIGMIKDIVSASSIFIKPNLTYPDYKKGVTTQANFIRDIVEMCTSVNSHIRIYIGEGEGGYNSFCMTDAMRSMGYYEIASHYPNVEIVNLSKLPARQVELRARGEPFLLNLPELFFNEVDFSISCPLPKVHCMTRLTLAFKNQWGCLPDVMRLKNHYAFDEIISQICDVLKFRYAFLDGKYGLDNNGPMIGDPVELNWFVASNCLGAFDKVVSQMMGFDWQSIRHLRMAAKYGFVPKGEDIEIIGDIDSLKRQFVLRRNFWNYLALVAFRSRRLTRLIYLSMWAQPLHDLMYTFRKRAVEQ
jgi:uncharacterized protein (DUF362 family)